VTRALVVRNKPATGPRIISRQLLRKNKLSKREWMWAHAWAWWLVLAAALVVIGAMGLVFGDGLATLVGVITSALGLVSVATGLGVALYWDDKSLGSAREAAILRTREANAAPHAGARKGRAKDVDYRLFVPYVWHEGTTVKVGIKTVYRDTDGKYGSPYWPYYNGEQKATIGADKAGTFGYYEGHHIRLVEPTLDEVDGTYTEIAEVAAQLEEEAYQQAVKLRKTERLVMIYQQPHGPMSERAKHFGDEIDEGIASLID
jgi:hypothetical protein